MERATRIDVISGVFLIAAGLLALWEVAGLDAGTVRNFGPAMLPRILASILLLVGLAMLALGLFPRGRAAEHLAVSLRGPLFVALSMLLFFATIRGMSLGGLAVPQLGLSLAGPLTIIVAGYASSRASLGELAAVGFGLTAACLAVFNDLLGQDIPVLPRALEASLTAALGIEGALRIAYAACALIAAAIFRLIRRPAASGR